MPDTMSLLGSEKAAQAAERLQQYELGCTPAEEVQEGIRAAGVMASLTLYAWDAVQQFVAKGLEGGKARDLVGKAVPTVAVWLKNIRVAIRIAEQWHGTTALPLSGEELRYLENRLQHVLCSAEQLLSLVNEPAPALPQDVLGRIETLEQADDKTEYLDAEVFLARMRARKGT